MQWLEKGLAAAWEITSEYLGPSSEGCKTVVRVLNRFLRWGKKAWSMNRISAMLIW